MKMIINDGFPDLFKNPKDKDLLTKNNIFNMQDYFNLIKDKFNEFNPKIKVESISKDIISDDRLKNIKYSGVLIDDDVIVAYLFILRPYIGTRNGFMSQQLFPGIGRIIDSKTNNTSIDVSNKLTYVINSNLEKVTASMKTTFLSIEIMGIRSVSVFDDQTKVNNDDISSIVGYAKSYRDEKNYSNEEGIIKNWYFDVDINNKLLKIKVDYLDQRDPKNLGSTPRFYEIRIIPAIILAVRDGYRIDYSDFEDLLTSSDDYKESNLLSIMRFINIMCKDSKKVIQKIYFGAPGTGKSYYVKNQLNLDGVEESRIFRTTFHPEYSYSDFVGQILPDVTKDRVTYKFKPGVFTKALKKAYMDLDSSVYLVIEELSRGNVSSIFGDVFQLLDRDVDNYSMYPIRNDLISNQVIQLDSDLVKLPPNLNIIGTVNTNDQNVFPMDTAFQRRFDWEYIDVSPKNDQDNVIINLKYGEDNIKTHWHDFYLCLNSYITNRNNGLGLDEDKQIGQFFINLNNNMSDEEISDMFSNKLLHYLWEDVEKASYSNHHLFDDDVASFSDLFKKSKEGYQLFSDEFLVSLENYRRS